MLFKRSAALKRRDDLPQSAKNLLPRPRVSGLFLHRSPYPIANLSRNPNLHPNPKLWTPIPKPYTLFPMAIPTSPLPVCRFAGLLAGNEEQFAAARFELAQ